MLTLSLSLFFEGSYFTIFTVNCSHLKVYPVQAVTVVAKKANHPNLNPILLLKINEKAGSVQFETGIEA
ncbi:MAG TPA: hypothetical protein VHW45_15840 [Candidatus Sulfotelmatobacter sp.]|nr:hypothetical protein [Candidatus Sulfotelmatobacter sp.]